MRVVVVGPGGVGALFGGLLARSGVRIAFVARGAHLAALSTSGLRVESPVASFALPHVEASDEPAALAPADFVLVAVKAWQVSEVAARLAPLVGDRTLVVPLENGVESADVLAAALGPAHVAGGLCHVWTWLEAPGHVRHVGAPPRAVVGEREPGQRQRLEALAAALANAGLDAAVANDIEAATWEKFLFIDPLGSVAAAARAPAGVLRSLPMTRELLVLAMHEVEAVARARGVTLAPDLVAATLAKIDALPPEATASMQRDIVAGRPSELFEQTGAIVRLAREHGVPTPVHDVLLACLLPQERRARGE